MSTNALPSAAPNRLFYLDTLRIVLTILVIAHHVGQAYGPTGGAWPVQETARAAVLGPFFTVNRSFFMSLFFMISGFFMVSAYDRHGFGAFIRSRAVRLGIPVLAFGALMIPFRVLTGGTAAPWNEWFDAGHLWYLEHVLVFSLVYAIWRALRRKDDGESLKTPSGKLPRLAVIIPVMLLVAVLCAAIRAWSPIDRWMNLLGFIKVAFADVPRDLAFFIFGTLAFRRGWFESYPTRKGMAWLAAGLVAAVAWYAWALIPHPSVTLSPLGYDIVYPIWEEVVCFGMCIGLLVLFRQAAGSQGRFGKLMAANQYSAYFWHPILIVAIQAGFLALALPPFVKFAAVTVIGVPLVFLWSALMRKIPAVRKVL